MTSWFSRVMRTSTRKTAWRRGFQPLGEFDREALVTGFTYFPEPDVAFKLDYTLMRNRSSFIAARDAFNLGLGWWF